MNRNAIVLSALVCLVAVHAMSDEGAGLDGAFAQAKRLNDSAAKISQVPAKATQPVEFVAIAGGKFTMGTDDGDQDAKPAHEVVVKKFEISKTLVTVEQYGECVAKGQCATPGTGTHCNWGKAGRQNHPINCVEWEYASQYAKFKQARLPTEAEYEYAAKNGGKKQRYPWGDAEAACDKAVMASYGATECGNKGTKPVCSKPAGNTAQGLCDMAGNVWEWMQDKYQSTYAGAPVDGSAFDGGGPNRVVRGGSFYSVFAEGLFNDRRNVYAPGDRGDGVGFRLAR